MRALDGYRRTAYARRCAGRALLALLVAGAVALVTTKVKPIWVIAVAATIGGLAAGAARPARDRDSNSTISVDTRRKDTREADFLIRTILVISVILGDLQIHLFLRNGLLRACGQR